MGAIGSCQPDGEEDVGEEEESDVQETMEGSGGGDADAAAGRPGKKRPPQRRDGSRKDSRDNKSDRSQPPGAAPAHGRLHLPSTGNDSDRRRELLALQREAQASQQRVVVQAARTAPGGQAGAEAPDVALDAVIGRILAGKRIVGPDPAGDLPADDSELEDCGTSQGTTTAPSSMQESSSPGVLGVTKKVCVDLNLAIDDSVDRHNGMSDDEGDLGESLDKWRNSPAQDQSDTGEPMIIRTAMPTRGPSISLEDASSGGGDSARATGVLASSGRLLLEAVHTKSLRAPGSPGGPPLPPPSSSAGTPRRRRRAAPALGGAGAPDLDGLVCADVRTLGTDMPDRGTRYWIESAIRNMFCTLENAAFDRLVEVFREWKLPAGALIMRQSAPADTGPGLCILVVGVVDVLHCPKGATECEKVCTYDRCGQCFGELELFYDAPGSTGAGRRRRHWATVVTRTAATLWAVEKHVVRGLVPGASSLAPVLPVNHKTTECII